MRVRLSVVIALWGVCVAGCVTGEKAAPGGWLASLRPSRGPVGSDVVQIDVALVERPLGDPYVNEELWQSADERVIGPERRAVMETSGFRVGLVSGLMTPPKLLEILTSERSNAAPRALQGRAGKPAPLALGPTLAVCRFEIAKDGLPVDVEFPQAECRLVVTATPAKDGRTALRFTPQIVHGEAEQVFRVADDRSTMVLDNRRPTEDYADLAWEATLGANEFVVVGGRYDRPTTLGHQCFVRPEEKKPVQRLLVIRGVAHQREAAVKAQPLPGGRDDDEATAKAPPLARQAAGPAP